VTVDEMLNATASSTLAAQGLAGGGGSSAVTVQTGPPSHRLLSTGNVSVMLKAT
jgi:hypothetical protein